MTRQEKPNISVNLAPTRSRSPTRFPPAPSKDRAGIVATGKDVLEYLMAGASAVQVGTANLVRPKLWPSTPSRTSRRT